MESESIKNFNKSLTEYFNQKTEEASHNLHRNLQVLAGSTGITLFNPGNRETMELFSNLYELMMTLDAKAHLTWASIDVLQQACRNPSARESLTHTFKFLPILTKFLDSKLILEKKIKILQLMQDLTYGIKISWQEAHLPHLISSLTKWITGDDFELVPLSLSVLVNLCYNNSAAVYTLMKSVNVKSFLKTLLKVQKSNTAAKVQVCKLLFILEGISGGVNDYEMETFIKSTCPTLKEAINLSNSGLMRHVIDFLKKIIQNESAKKVVNNYPNYAEDIEGLLNLVSDADNLYGDCIAALFDYFSCVIGLNILGLEGLYPHFLILALQWLKTDDVANDAIQLISNIVNDLFTKESKNTPPEKLEIMESVQQLLDEHLPIILSLIEIGSNEVVLSGNEVNLKLTALLHLLTQMVRLEKFSDKIISLLDQQVFRKLFDPLISPECEENVLFQKPVYTFYVEALCFITDLSDRETNWLLLYNEMLQEKQVQTVLSIALYTGSEYIKKKVLTLTGTAGFLTECIGLLAKRMAELNKLVIFSPSNLANQEQQAINNSSYISPIDMVPMLTITQEGHLNSVIEKCEQAIRKNEGNLTSAIMELYQYKMAAMNQNLRQLLMSQEAADLRATRLQHNLCLTNSEVSRLHQLLYGSQQSLELATKETNSLASQLSQVKQEAQETHNKYSEVLQNLRSKTLIISQQNQEIESYKNQIGIKEDKIANLEEELKLKTEEHSQTNSELIEAREAISALKKNLTSLEATVETSKKEILQQSLVLSKLEKVISEKDKEISELNKELSEQRRMREIISELAMGKRKLDK